MSYGVTAYLVDTNDLLKLLDGSAGKKGFLSKFFAQNDARSKILAAFDHDFAELDESIEEMMEDDDAPGKQALSRQVLDEFLSNKIGQSTYNFVYAYVFKIICEYLGSFLDNSEWYPCSSDNHLGIPFTSMVLPVKFPPPDDWPVIDHIKYQDINISIAKFDNMDEAQRARLIDWFTQAINAKKDIYLFYN